MGDLFGGDDAPETYHRPPAYREPARRGRSEPPRANSVLGPLINSIAAKDLRPGHMIRVADPPGNARVKEARVLPESRIERGIGGGDPQPAVFVRFLVMDGAERGKVDEAMLHPEDKIRTAL